MKRGGRMLLAGAACVALAAMPRLAASAGAPSEADIANGLRVRGLPTLGTAPAPQPHSNPDVAPASLPSPSAAARHGAAARRRGTVATRAAVGTRPEVSLTSIRFGFNSAALLPSSIQTLTNLGHALNRELKNQKKFLIEGHTDATGTPAYNLELSKRRAEAVKDYLVQHLGVAADRLQTIGKGASDPADPNNPYSAANRRVVVVNVGAS